MGCTRCGLASTRTQAVFGVGPPGAALMFVGEAPGEDEDRQGEPFVGRAGQLLTRTLEKVGVRRDRVYIANILKCRPPGNRTPQFDEMASCMPFLLKQVQYVRPKLLCALGNVACQALLGSKKGITQIRGRILEVNGMRIFPTFHPAYVLRNMGEKGLFETDLRKACLEAGLL
jgi:DNA polymerase